MTLTAPASKRRKRSNAGGGGGGSGQILSGARIAKNHHPAQAKPNHRQRSTSRSTALLGEEMERDAAYSSSQLLKVPSFSLAKSPSSFKTDSPPFRIADRSHHPLSSAHRVVPPRPIGERVMPESLPRTPLKSLPGMRERTASEKNLMLTPVSGGTRAPKNVVTTPSSLTPNFKVVQNNSPRMPDTPQSMESRKSTSSKFTGFSIDQQQLQQQQQLQLFSPVASTRRRGPSRPVSLRQINFSTQTADTSRRPVVHPFWSPSPKKTWTYLITGGVSDFLHCAIANVEDLMELQKNSSVYFSKKESAPFSMTHDSEDANIKSFTRWNRFSWKVQLQRADSDIARQVILISPHNKGEEEIELAVGMKISLGSPYQELSDSKVYLKWRVVDMVCP